MELTDIFPFPATVFFSLAIEKYSIEEFLMVRTAHTGMHASLIKYTVTWGSIRHLHIAIVAVATLPNVINTLG